VQGKDVTIGALVEVNTIQIEPQKNV
jgi:hypothetical protein